MILPKEKQYEGQFAWLVGIVEGEGCFYMYRSNKGRRKHVRFQLGMTDEDVVRKVANLIGMKSIQYIPPNEREKGLYRINCSGWRAEELMWSVFPYLGKRRRSRILEIGSERFRDRLSAVI